MNRIQISVIIAAAATYWMAGLWLRKIDLSIALLVPFSSVVGMTMLTILIFNRYVWHWPIFYGWLVQKPCIRGTWFVELQSSYIDEAGKKIGPIKCFMVIRQHYDFMSIRLITKESKSESIAASIVQNNDGTYDISAVYRNKPSPDFQYRSHMHVGALILHTSQQKPLEIEGSYWTDRNTTGTLKLYNPMQVYPDTYTSAEAFFLKTSD